jgi:hypothetical protein
MADEPAVAVNDAYADARAAFNEITTGEAPAAPAVESSPEPKATADVPEPKAKIETAEQKADRVRDELGRFAAKEQEAKTEIGQPEVKPEPKYGSPPGNWSVRAKSQWERLPGEVREAILADHKSHSDGIAQYSAMQDIAPYVEKAQRSGTTLKAALDNYTAIEDMLRTDPVAGHFHIAQNSGYSPHQLVQLMAQRLGLGSKRSAQPTGQGGSPDPSSMLQQYLNPLAQQVNELKRQLSQREQAEQRAQLQAANSAMERFKSDPAHRFFDNVRPQMAKLFEAGLVQETGDTVADMKKAYELACYQNPEIRELLIEEKMAKAADDRKAQEKDAAEKARKASRSITGSSSNTVREAEKDRASPHDDARRAYREAAARV